MLPDHVLSSYAQTLEHFVLRARKIEQHSLCLNKAELSSLASPSLTFTFDADFKNPKISRAVPDDERVESLAAITRPVALSDDGCYYTDVLKALKGFLYHQGTSKFDSQLEELEKEWKQRIENSRDSSRKNMKAGSPASQVGDGDLAWGWIYGELVHHDADRRLYLKNFNINTLYEAAIWLVCKIAELSIALLDVIRAASDESLVQLNPECFEKSVKFSAAHYDEVIQTGLYVGKPGGQHGPVDFSVKDLTESGYTEVKTMADMLPDADLARLLQENFTQSKARSFALFGNHFLTKNDQPLDKQLEPLFSCLADTSDFEGCFRAFEAYGVELVSEDRGQYTFWSFRLSAPKRGVSAEELEIILSSIVQFAGGYGLMNMTHEGLERDFMVTLYKKVAGVIHLDPEERFRRIKENLRLTDEEFEDCVARVEG